MGSAGRNSQLQTIPDLRFEISFLHRKSGRREINNYGGSTDQDVGMHPW